MKGKKFVLMLTIAFLLGAIIPSIPPVEASSTVKIYVKPEFPSYVPGSTVGAAVDVEVWIDSPPEWTDTASGIVGWAMNVHVDSAVLEPLTVLAATSGYWLYDFIDSHYYYGHEPSLLKTVDKPSGNFTGVSEFIFGWETLGLGAGGSGKLCTLRYKSLSATAYTLIDLFDVYYYTIAPSKEEGKHPVDVVVDGHYNQPPFKYLHATSSLINLSNPVGTSWHELYPTYSTTSSLNDWTDNGDSILSSSDFIKLGTDWYHVEQVTVTIYTYRRAKGTDYYYYFEFLGWLPHMDEAIASPEGTFWHEVYGEAGGTSSGVFCTKYNLTVWSDADGSGNLTINDGITLMDLATLAELTWSVVGVSTDIIISGPVVPEPEFPFGLALETGLIVAIAYVWLRSRRKTKITRQAKLAY